jgi:hypothetical protein
MIFLETAGNGPESWLVLVFIPAGDGILPDECRGVQRGKGLGTCLAEDRRHFGDFS